MQTYPRALNSSRMDTVLESQSLEKSCSTTHLLRRSRLGVRSSPSLLVTTCAVAEEPGARYARDHAGTNCLFTQLKKSLDKGETERREEAKDTKARRAKRLRIVLLVAPRA